MKTTSFRKGFTLVEIMIVVVIIGLLAALAIPAFKKVRNNAIEKTLINDARQIASAAQQHMSENASTYATVNQIGKFLAGGKLSSGVACSKNITTAPTAIPSDVLAGADWNANGANTIVVQQGEYFALGHVNYDRTLSSNSTIGAQSGTNVLTFTDAGTLK